MNLEPFKSLLDELLDDLVAHHQRKREAGLAQRKLELILKGLDLSWEFKKKWENRCEKVDSIDCRIGDDEDEEDSHWSSSSVFHEIDGDDDCCDIDQIV